MTRLTPHELVSGTRPYSAAWIEVSKEDVMPIELGPRFFIDIVGHYGRCLIMRASRSTWDEFGSRLYFEGLYGESIQLGN